MTQSKYPRISKHINPSFLCLCLQPLSWCEAACDEAVVFLPAFEDQDDPCFRLSQAQALTAAAYMQTAQFHPILISLDTDEERVKTRDKDNKDCSDYEDSRRTNGATEAATWMGIQEEDLPMMPNFQEPTSFNVQLKRMLLNGVDESTAPPCYKMLVAMVLILGTQAHNMAWQMNTLRDYVQTRAESKADEPDHKETLIARFPYLEDCKQHVWDIAHTKLITMLSRSEAVLSFTFLPRFFHIYVLTLYAHTLPQYTDLNHPH